MPLMSVTNNRNVLGYISSYLNGLRTKDGIRGCIYCGKTFKLTNRGRYYCSKDCSREAHYIRFNIRKMRKSHD